jgi:hypothetical protein
MKQMSGCVQFERPAGVMSDQLAPPSSVQSNRRSTYTQPWVSDRRPIHDTLGNVVKSTGLETAVSVEVGDDSAGSVEAPMLPESMVAVSFDDAVAEGLLLGGVPADAVERLHDESVNTMSNVSGRSICRDLNEFRPWLPVSSAESGWRTIGRSAGDGPTVAYVSAGFDRNRIS